MNVQCDLIRALHMSSIYLLYNYLIFIIGLLQRGHQFIGLVFALQLGMGLFALRLFQIYPTLLLLLRKCHLSVYNISERSNQSSFTRQKIVCILTFMCLKEVSCFCNIFVHLSRSFCNKRVVENMQYFRQIEMHK